MPCSHVIAFAIGLAAGQVARMLNQMITANGLQFHVATAGAPANPMLLFLHGFPEYSGAWAELFERLSDTYFCVAPDQRGYGQSSKPDGVAAYATGKLAADAAAVLTHFSPAAHAVIGHDWGASVAYALAFSRPKAMKRLIILNGAHPIPFQRELAAGGAQSAASQYFHLLRSDDAERVLGADHFAHLRQMFAKGMDMSWMAGTRATAYEQAWSVPGALTGMVNWYRATPLKVAAAGSPIPADQLIPFDPARLRVTMPHLLIWGMNDTALLPSCRDGLADLCEDLTMKEIDGADHWLHHQKPDDVADAIRRFCQ